MREGFERRTLIVRRGRDGNRFAGASARGPDLAAPATPSGRGANPSGRGAKPKRTWRPNPNPCQLFPIAAHCRFEPFQGLGRSRKRRPALTPCRPCPFHIKHVRQQFCLYQFSPRPFGSSPSTPPLARLRFLTSGEYLATIPMLQVAAQKTFTLSSGDIRKAPLIAPMRDIILDQLVEAPTCSRTMMRKPLPRS